MNMKSYFSSRKDWQRRPWLIWANFPLMISLNRWRSSVPSFSHRKTITLNVEIDSRLFSINKNLNPPSTFSIRDDFGYWNWFLGVNFASLNTFNQSKSFSQLRFEYNTIFISPQRLYLVCFFQLKRHIQWLKISLSFDFLVLKRFEWTDRINSVRILPSNPFQSEQTITSFGFHHIEIIRFNGIDPSHLSFLFWRNSIDDNDHFLHFTHVELKPVIEADSFGSISSSETSPNARKDYFNQFSRCPMSSTIRAGWLGSLSLSTDQRLMRRTVSIDFSPTERFQFPKATQSTTCAHTEHSESSKTITLIIFRFSKCFLSSSSIDRMRSPTIETFRLIKAITSIGFVIAPCFFIKLSLIPIDFLSGTRSLDGTDHTW